MKHLMLLLFFFICPFIHGQKDSVPPPPAPPRTVVANTYQLTQERKALIHKLIEIEGWEKEYQEIEQEYLTGNRLTEEQKKEWNKTTSYESFLEYLYKSYDTVNTKELYKIVEDLDYRNTHFNARYACNTLKTPVKNYFSIYYFLISYE